MGFINLTPAFALMSSLTVFSDSLLSETRSLLSSVVIVSEVLVVSTITVLSLVSRCFFVLFLTSPLKMFSI